MKFTALENKVRSLAGDNFDSTVRRARLYWNPRNFDGGDNIRRALRVNELFDAVIKRGTGRNRWLFNFHDLSMEEMADPQTVMEAFLNCKNWSRYSELWMEHAPKDLRHRAILLYAITDMTVQGGRKEWSFFNNMKKRGHKVEKSTAVDDANGVDFYVDGKPVQVKSEATIKAAQRKGQGGDWV